MFQQLHQDFLILDIIVRITICPREFILNGNEPFIIVLCENGQDPVLPGMQNEESHKNLLQV